jgi:uncharacterized protein with HEPN domain
VQDILGCIHNIQSFVAGLTAEAFANDPKTIRAVAFEFSVMGEATRAIPESVRQQHPEVPWEQMQGMRNVIIHEYFRIDEEVLWNTIHLDLPPLVPVLEKLVQ